jgi:amidohydrolase
VKKIAAAIIEREGRILIAKRKKGRESMIRKFLYGIFICLCLFSVDKSLFSQSRNTDKKIQEIVREILPELIEIRRDIHAHPELAFEEKRTSAIAAAYLEKLGLEVKKGFAKTGLLAILRGQKGGPVIGMRADMDALPLSEKTGLPFSSQEKIRIDGIEYGVMHACGHDVHTTVLLGVAGVLSRLKDNFNGTILFIVQPAEEKGDGANEMLKEGLFRDIKPEAMFAFHVNDTAKAGVISYTPGYSGANCDGFRLVIKSEGCHGASPSSCVDPIVVGSQVVVALQVMVSREIDVNRNTVITVGSFHAGSASNIIPEKAELQATVRTYGDEQRKLVRQKVERLVTNICEGAGAQFELGYYFATPSLYNDPALLKEILPTVERVLGGKEFLKEELPEMGGEDFSYFAREAPSVMLGLGVVPEEVAKTSVHSPTFIVDEQSIPLGVKVMSSVILDYLNTHKKH